MERQTANKYETALVHQLAFLAAGIILVLIGLLIAQTPQSLQTEYILEHFNVSLKDFYPDGADKLIYFACTLLSVFAYFGAYIFFSRLLRDRKPGGVWAFTLDILGLIAAVAAAVVTIGASPSYIKLFTKAHPDIFGLATVLAVLILGLIIVKRQTGQKVVFGLIAAGSMLATAYLYIVPNYYRLDAFARYHFEAYFYPVYKVVSGQTPLVDFSSLYGFYPYIIAPIVGLFPDSRILAFSIVVAVLILLSLAAVSYTLFTVLEDKRIALIGSLAAMFTIYVIPLLANAGGSYYLQYQPHRILMPALLVAFCTFYAKSRNKSALYVLGFVFSAFALLWNIDTGVVVVVSWTAFQLYRSAYERNLNDRSFYLETGRAILSGGAAILLAGVVLLVITYARTGEVVDIMKSLASQTLFYKYGYYMLPTPLLHPWILLVLVYGISLAKSIRNLKVLRADEAEYGSLLSSLYFLLPVIGMGIFSYYNGRSHELVFLAIVWPGVVLLALFCQEYLRRLKKDGWRGVNLLKFVLALWLLSVFAAGQLLALGNPEVLKILKNKPAGTDYLAPAISLIEKVRVGDEPLELIMFSSASIYERLGEKMTANVPAVVDWFTKEDYRMVLDELEKSEDKVIMDRYAYELLMRYEAEEFNRIMEENYVLILQEQDILVYDQRD